MVNSIPSSFSGSPSPGPRVSAGPSVGSSGTKIPVEDLSLGGGSAEPVKASSDSAASPPVAASGLQNLEPPFTSLALYKDTASGLQVAVIKDKLSGDVVEQIPSERVRRLAAMLRQQELAQQLRQEESGEDPHIDLTT